MEQKEYWNSVSGTKTFTLAFDAEAFSRYAEKDAAVADVGCGYGRVLRILRDEGYTDLAGYDFSPLMIERARRECPDAGAYDPRAARAARGRHTVSGPNREREC